MRALLLLSLLAALLPEPSAAASGCGEFCDFFTKTVPKAFTNGLPDAWDKTNREFQDATRTTQKWYKRGYSKTVEGFVAFLEDAGRDLDDFTDAVRDEVVEPAADWCQKRVDYFEEDFLNDMKAISEMVLDTLTNVCNYPLGQLAMKMVCAKAVDLAICSATSGVPPFCWSAALGTTLKITGGLVAIEIAAKCAVYETIKAFAKGKMCDGMADSIADDTVLLLFSAALGVGDIPCGAAVECMCGGCPFTCDYYNREMCSGEWWKTMGGAVADAIQSEEHARAKFNATGLTPALVPAHDRRLHFTFKSLSSQRYLIIDDDQFRQTVRQTAFGEMPVIVDNENYAKLVQGPKQVDARDSTFTMIFGRRDLPGILLHPDSLPTAIEDENDGMFINAILAADATSNLVDLYEFCPEQLAVYVGGKKTLFNNKICDNPRFEIDFLDASKTSVTIRARQNATSPFLYLSRETGENGLVRLTSNLDVADTYEVKCITKAEFNDASGGYTLLSAKFGMENEEGGIDVLLNVAASFRLVGAENNATAEVQLPYHRYVNLQNSTKTYNAVTTHT